MVVVALVFALIRLALISIVTFLSIKDKPTARNESLLDSRMVNIVNVVYQFVLSLQYFVLLHGMYKFQKYMTEESTETDQPEEKCCSCTLTKVCVVVTFMLIGYILTLIVAPVLLSMWFKDFVLWYDEETLQHVAGVYAGMAWFRYLSNLLLSGAMTVAARLAVLQWSSAKNKLDKKTTKTLTSDDQHQESGKESDNKTTDTSTSDKIIKLFDNYKKVGEKVAALNTIFQGWFITQWGIFFIAVTINVTLLLKSLLNEEYTVEPRRFAYITALVAFDVYAFFIPYILGVIINSKHNKFYEFLKERKEDILSKAKDEHMKMMVGLDLIPKQSKYEFLPTLSVISIPLDSGSYILTIVLAVFTFVATFLVTFADISNI